MDCFLLTSTYDVRVVVHDRRSPGRRTTYGVWEAMMIRRILRAASYNMVGNMP
jgi:hypothetical protein